MLKRLTKLSLCKHIKHCHIVNILLMICQKKKCDSYSGHTTSRVSYAWVNF